MSNKRGWNVENITSANGDILNKLYSKYYKTAEKSSVTISHWAKCGSRCLVRKSGDRFIVEGFGFGTFIRPNFLRFIKYCIPLFLSRSLLNSYVSNNDIKIKGWEVIKKQNRLCMFDEVKQIIICDLLDKHEMLKQSKTIVVIGDGYGFMTCLLRLLVPQAKIICVNLGKILFFDFLHVSKVFPGTKMFLVEEKDDVDKAIEHYPIVFLEAEKYEILFNKSLDLFINVASMGEMNTDVIRTYFDIFRSSTGKRFFYSCNRVEKTLSDGTVNRFDDYPWNPDKDTIIFDELCAFYKKFPISFPPFWRSFDDPLKHRLVKLGAGISFEKSPKISL